LSRASGFAENNSYHLQKYIAYREQLPYFWTLGTPTIRLKVSIGNTMVTIHAVRYVIDIPLVQAMLFSRRVLSITEKCTLLGCSAQFYKTSTKLTFLLLS